MNDVAVSQLVRTDQGALAQIPELSARAFDDYPFTNALFPGPPMDPRRAEIARHFYGATVRDCLEHGVVDVAMDGERVAGYAAWVNPGAYPLSLRRSAAFLPVARATLRHYSGRARLGVNALYRLEKGHPKKPPHWYLSAIAVDPDFQGRGVGAQLMAAGLARVDEDRRPAFLETTRPYAKVWYARLGFEVLTVSPCFPGGPPQWYQWRDHR